MRRSTAMDSHSCLGLCQRLRACCRTFSHLKAVPPPTTQIPVLLQFRVSVAVPHPSLKMLASTEVVSLLASPALCEKHLLEAAQSPTQPPAPVPSCRTGKHHLKHCTVPRARQSRPRALRADSLFLLGTIYGFCCRVCFNQNDCKVMETLVF